MVDGQRPDSPDSFANMDVFYTLRRARKTRNDGKRGF